MHPNKINIDSVLFQNSSDSNHPEISIFFNNSKENSSGSIPHKRLQSPTKSSCSSASTCRICHEGDCLEGLISPCECTGTVGLVHIRCLETWLSTSNSEQCEICKFIFKIHREKRTLKEWLQSGEGLTGPNGFYGDILCILLLTPLCLVSIYLCAAGAFTYFGKGLWEGVGLAVISATILMAYILWVYMTIRFHLRCLRAWRNSNPIIQLATPNQRTNP